MKPTPGEKACDFLALRSLSAAPLRATLAAYTENYRFTMKQLPVLHHEGRRWMAFEALPEYVAASSFRLLDKDTPLDVMKSIYTRILAGESVNIEAYLRQSRLDLREEIDVYGS